MMKAVTMQTHQDWRLATNISSMLELIHDASHHCRDALFRALLCHVCHIQGQDQGSASP